MQTCFRKEGPGSYVFEADPTEDFFLFTPSRMRNVSVFARVVALHLLLMQAVSPAVAATGEIVVDDSSSDQHVETTIEADSTADTHVDTTASGSAVQETGIEGEAGIIVESEQSLDTHDEVEIDQECGSASGTGLCYSDASPTVRNVATQVIDVSAENDMSITQTAGSGATQGATATGTALADVTATQTVTTDVIVDIFQDCSMQTGVCVQRALPEVLTLATQVIAASAVNNLAIEQEAGSGSVQDADADLLAQVNVTAEQFVSPRTFLSLTQLCAIDVGMCIQRALPVVQDAVQQVIDAQAHNNTDIAQEAGGNSSQTATVVSDASTNVTAVTDVDARTTIEMIQRCGVGKGLCLTVDGAGNPAYVFSDGETTTSGQYTGTLDESILADEYSRRTVGTVASGICGGASSCSMVEQLLFWLFGPEPQPETAGPSFAREGNGGSYARRGHETNVLGGSIRFLAQRMEEDESFAPPAFGGSDDALAPAQRALVCSMRTRLLKQESASEGLWDWTADEIARLTGLSADAAAGLLRDESVCPRENVAAAKPALNVTFFPVSHDGPVSGNAFWNACVRGEHVTLEQVRTNPDRDEDGLPRTCGSYHTGNSWYHPELNIHFTWDRATGYLQLPEGYVPAASGVAAAANQI